MPCIPRFSPSRNGFVFTNRFPEVPLEIEFSGRIWKVWNAANGLCGGMTFLACDRFLAGMQMPPDPTAPGSGPLFRALCKRQLDSFDLPQGFVRYLEWMSPLRPDSGASWLLQDCRSLTLDVEWPRIRARLDAGKPAPLGLIHTRSWSPMDVGRNHQVLAYGYVQEKGRLQLMVLDPNHPGDDSIRITCELADRQAPLGWNGSSSPLRGFFLSRYAFQSP